MSSKKVKLIETAVNETAKVKKGNTFQDVISALYGVNVNKIGSRHKKSMELIISAVCQVYKMYQKSPLEGEPIKVGNLVDNAVLQALTDAGLNASKPLKKSGGGKSSGYPDIEIKMDVGVFYLEVKTFTEKTSKSTQRSFYVSPSDDPKVTEDAVHLLVGFKMERNDNKSTPIAFEVVDLYGLDCDMKSEFNSDNKRLYEASRILAQEQV